MKLLEIRTEIKKQAKAIIYSNLLFSLIIMILGIVLLVTKEHIINYIEYIVFVFFIQAIILNLFLYWKYKDKLLLIFLIANSLTLILFLILFLIFNKDPLDIIAYFMGISSILNAIECIVEIKDENKDNDLRNEIISLIIMFIEIGFAISLFINKGSSVKTHLILFGILFIIKGLISIISLISSKHI